MKRYFIVLPKGYNGVVFRQYMNYLAEVSGANPFNQYISQAKYLVTNPSNTWVQWGERNLEAHKRNPDLIELSFYMENV